jgi:hypothetical protein
MRAVARFSQSYPNVNRSEHEIHSTRDGFLEDFGGQSFRHHQHDAKPGFSHLSRYIQLIRLLREPRLMAITKALGLTSHFDHRHISRNLERATYLPDGTPVFEHSWSPRTQMRHAGNNLVGLACWMALDGLVHLFPESADREIGTALQIEWDEIAFRFANESELSTDASLFTGKREETQGLLKAELEKNMRLFPPVTPNACELHLLLNELLYSNLTGLNGEIFGLKGFHHVWESACLEYAVQKYGIGNVLTCDDSYWQGSFQAKWVENRNRVFAKNGLKRRPDLVVKMADGTYLIVDFKYYAADDTRSNLASWPPRSPSLQLLKTESGKFASEWKSYQDIANVEAYRWRLMQYELNSSDSHKVKIELWVPDTDERQCQCPWMDGLSIVGKSARDVIGAYARRFRLMD